jgi:TetR/AcrR family transcriptional regulator, cholesterol catabolism regulator
MAAPPTRPALRRRYDSRRQDVIDVAARAFAERGYHATSMDDLSEATGLAPGGLYHYIGSKEQLLIAICDTLMDPLLERAEELVRGGVGRETLGMQGKSGPPPLVEAVVAFRALVRLWVGHVVEHRHHMRVFAQERQVIEHGPQWRTVRQSRERFEALLDDALAVVERDGAASFADRGLAKLALLGMINHLPQWYRPRGRLGPEEIAEAFCDLLLTPAAREIA